MKTAATTRKGCPWPEDNTRHACVYGAARGRQRKQRRSRRKTPSAFGCAWRWAGPPCSFALCSPRVIFGTIAIPAVVVFARFVHSKLSDDVEAQLARSRRNRTPELSTE